MDAWAEVKAGRGALADYLEALDAADWQKPSLCAGWSVKDLACHLLVIPTTPKPKVVMAFAKSGFNLDKMSQGFVQRLGASLTTADIVRTMRESAGSHNTPPGVKLATVLAETVVHSGDISVPVGKPLPVSVDAAVYGLNALKDEKAVFGVKDRINGLALTTADADWSHGAGLAVNGPAQLLLMAMTGRKAVLDQLTGEGVATLRGRQ